MKRIYFIVVFMLFTCSAIAELPSSPGKNVDLLRELEVKYGSLKKFQLPFIQETLHPEFASADTFKGVIRCMEPDMFRIDYNVPTGQFVIAHGDTMWLFTPENMQMMRCSGAESLDFIGLMKKYFDSSGVKTEEKEGEFIVSIEKPDEEFGYSSLVFSFEKHNLSLLTMELTDPAGIKTRYIFGVLDTVPDFTSELFAIKLPDGADMVDCNGEILKAAETQN